jgi:hypothetical protein
MFFVLSAGCSSPREDLIDLLPTELAKKNKSSEGEIGKKTRAARTKAGKGAWRLQKPQIIRSEGVPGQPSAEELEAASYRERFTIVSARRKPKSGDFDRSPISNNRSLAKLLEVA